MSKDQKSLTVVGLIIAIAMLLLYWFRKQPASLFVGPIDTRVPGTEVTLGYGQYGTESNPTLPGLPIGTGLPESEYMLPITPWWGDQLPLNQKDLIRSLNLQGLTPVQVENLRYQLRY